MSRSGPWSFQTAAAALRAAEELGIPFRRIDLETCQEAQDSPCVYGVFGIFLNGQLLSYHPIGKKRLLELLQARTGDEGVHE